MKLIRFFALLAMFVTLFAMPFAAHAQDAEAARNQLISQHCKSLQSLVDQLQRRDLVSRTNLGREYESIARELNAFNQRVHNNNLSSQQYEQLTAQFTDATNQFRDAYVHYDDSLTKLQQTDCQAKPADFTAQLLQTRGLRDTTEGASTHAAAVVGQYRDMMVELQTQLPDQAAKGSAQ